MDKLLKIWSIIKPGLCYLILAYTGIHILLYHTECHMNFIFIFALDISLMIFTFLYINHISRKKNDNKFLIISMLTFIFIWFVSGTDNIYYFVLLDDIFDITEFKLRIKFILFHFLGILLYLPINKFIFINKNIEHIGHSLISTILIYIVVLLIFGIIHNYKYQRDNMKMLNFNLIEYSFKERAYLLSEERSRISQELHDSIGHSLMAISMNIRYLKALKDKDKIQAEIIEIETLVKESINTLRSTVYNLKELDEHHNLREEITKIIQKFNELGIVKINFDFSTNINFSSNRLENILLTTIKEGITNSLKHGNPSTIDISIKIINDDLQLIISDNGQGCKYINKSNGLNGITERIKKINGEVAFTSSINKGFTIKTLIPGGILND